MSISDLLVRSSGPVRIRLSDGSVHTGRFRTDILSERAVSAFFYGDVRDMSLPVSMIDEVEAVAG
jgi:hypothetical protein